MAFASDSNESKNMLGQEPVESFCASVSVFETSRVPTWSSPRRWPTILTPWEVLACSSAEFSNELLAKLSLDPPDVIQFEGVAMLQYQQYAQGIPCVAFPHDSLTLALERETPENILHSFRLALNRLQARRLERIYGSFAASVFVAEPDALRAKQIVPSARIFSSPNGVDSEYFSPSGRHLEPFTVAFHGSMGFSPNVEAALWFLERAWPSLKQRHPRARVWLVGSNPSERLLSAARTDADIVVTGSVPDIRPYLDAAAVLVAPMQSGAGIKNKVLEGMSMGKPVVVTPLAIAGIESAAAGRHVVLANSDQELIDRISELWQEPELAARIGAEARSLVTEKYSWKNLADACERLLRSVAAGEVPSLD